MHRVRGIDCFLTAQSGDHAVEPPGATQITSGGGDEDEPPKTARMATVVDALSSR